MTRKELLEKLAAAGVPDPAGDLRRLERAYSDPGALAEAVARRADRVPVSQIVGRRAFWTSEFVVTPDVLDPRPETEVLVEQALSEPFSNVLDLGTGSGCILISLLQERPLAKGVGTDISEKAVLVAGENAARLGVADRLVLPVSDWFADVGGRFDLIVSNPPYIAVGEMAGLQPEVRDHEPRMALTDEGDGLGAYRAIAAGAPDHLVPGGRLLVEIGATQAVAVCGFFRSAGLEDILVHADLDGRVRVVSARKSAAE
ncbi:MAG: peptide chain release factor N(5)-glutamine methyltransferase [Silicimonas sp.]|jgi:release factor glutamine methyltransferase|nr:peptide chain release factor N(5)-glutamine methyltransferase [Silicimonas sp.]